VTFFVEAYHTANTEGDDFTFSYSIDGTTWTTLLTVTKTSDDNVAQQAALPDGLSGTVYIRVVDTNRAPYKNVLDSLFIDKMFIRSDPSIAGDANVDGVVDALDYITLKQTVGMTAGAAWNDGDFDQDGDVDQADLYVFEANIGRSFTLVPAAAPILSGPAPIVAAPAAGATAGAAEIIGATDTTIAPAAAAPEPTAPAPAQATPPDRTTKLLGAMAGAAQNDRVDVLAAFASKVPTSPFATRNRSCLLPWWLRHKRTAWPLPAEE
jgi:hypothetical protein